MKLYTFEIAPNPRRLALFMAYKGIELETQHIDLGPAREQLSEAYRAINPSCTVPALQLDDGRVLTETIGICLYLESLYPQRPLFGSTPLEQALVVSWDHRIFVEGLMAVAEAFRNRGDMWKGRALPGRHDVEQIAALVERGRQRLACFWDVLEEQLANGDFLIGSQVSFADIDLYVLVYFAAWIKEAIPDHCERLKVWHARVQPLLEPAG